MDHDILIDGKSYHLTADDLYLEQMGADFEPHMVALFKKLIRKQDCVFDVGANIGLTGILFGNIAKQVVCFEPSPTTCSLLRNNISAARLHNIEVVNLGLGAQAEEVTLTFATNNRSGGFVSDQVRPLHGHTTENIQIARLDDVYQEFSDNINFIKIDVEGYEGEVIKGMAEVLKRFQPIVVLELNHWCLNAFRRISVPDFFDLLRENFPYVYAIDTDGDIKNLHSNDEAYYVMHEHLVKFKYPNIACGFRDNLLEQMRVS
jgi:FkbM family methyltransferase